MILAAVFFLRWEHRVARNIRALGATAGVQTGDLIGLVASVLLAVAAVLAIRLGGIRSNGVGRRR